jgi:hypothetical protein
MPRKATTRLPQFEAAPAEFTVIMMDAFACTRSASAVHSSPGRLLEGARATTQDDEKAGAARLLVVMAGLVPAIHVFASTERKTWMPATSAGMTNFWLRRYRSNGMYF